MQWEILDLAFRRSTLVLIGDPKQAIYSFRGADVFAYLAAAQSAASAATLEHQLAERPGSDRRLRRSVRRSSARPRGDRLLPGHAALPTMRRRISGAPSCAPLRVRILDRRKVELTKNGCCHSPARRSDYIAARPRRSTSRALLSSRASMSVGRDSGRRIAETDGSWRHRSSRPGQRHANTVRDALVESGVPAVVAGGWERLRVGSRDRLAAAPLRYRQTHVQAPRGDCRAHTCSSDGAPIRSRPRPTKTGRTFTGAWRGGPPSSADGGWLRCSSRSLLRGLPARVLALPSGERVLDRSLPRRQAPAFRRGRSRTSDPLR